MVRSHHERFDGGGYPDGLAGEEIPLAARILTVADALDAMTSDRPYRKALPLEVALEEIEAKAGQPVLPEGRRRADRVHRGRARPGGAATARRPSLALRAAIPSGRLFDAPFGQRARQDESDERTPPQHR